MSAKSLKVPAVAAVVVVCHRQLELHIDTHQLWPLRACQYQNGMENEQRVGKWQGPLVCRRLLVEATDGHAEPRASDFHALPN